MDTQPASAASLNVHADFQAGGQITSEPDRYTSAWFDK